MPVVYEADVETARMNATRAEAANGTLVIGTAGMATVIAEFTLTASAGSVTDDIWSPALVAAEVSALADGIAAAAVIRDAGGNLHSTGYTVGLTGSGAEITLVNTNIKANQPVRLNSLTIKHG